MNPIQIKKNQNIINNNEQLDNIEDQKENGNIIINEEINENEEIAEIDEIAEEELEQDENKNMINNEESQNSKNQGEESQGKIEKLFIFLRTGCSRRPIPTINTTTLCLEITGGLFILIGIIIVSLSNEIVEIEIRYDNLENCKVVTNSENSTCEVNFTIEKDMKKNVFVYYRLKNFYQNHRRYIKSKSNKQLKGNVMEENEIKDDCDPIILNKDIYLGVKALNGTELDPDGVAHPCGLIAKSYFNDTFEIIKQGGNEEIIILGNDIAWKVDKEKYHDSPNYSSHQWMSVEDERFMVWMRPAALPDFRKPWGRIERDLSEGNYTLIINNRYPVKSFDGEKYFILSTVNSFGGKNYFLGILYLVLGGISILTGILFWFGYKKYNMEKSQKTD